MSYVSPFFMFFFFPAVVGVYQMMAKKWRWIVLLVASLVFFYMYSAFLIAFLILTTFITYKLGIELEKDDPKGKENSGQKRIILFGVLMIVSVLVYLKYSGFIETNINQLLSMISLPNLHLANTFGVPIGISFYSLQAISYLVDVYRKRIRAENNLFKIMLYLSFFPIIIEGPIVRYDSIGETLFEGNSIRYDSLRSGLLRIVWGIFKKIVIADRLNTFIINIFDITPTERPGSIILIGAIAYTLQLYMDFSGMIDVTIGIGRVFDIELPENFKQPFFAKTINEFWSRWHITLGTWIKDYIFYPVLLSKPFKKFSKRQKTSKDRKRAGVLLNSSALFVAWFVNGIWHGTGWSFIIFGMYYFILLTLGMICEPYILKFHKKLNINKSTTFYRVFQFLKLSFLVVLGELLFRANGGLTGLKMAAAIFTRFNVSSILGNNLLNYGMDQMDWIVVFVAMLLVVIVSVCKEKDIQIEECILAKPVYFRWTVYYGLIFSIVIFGAYGQGYIPVEIIYGKF